MDWKKITNENVETIEEFYTQGYPVIIAAKNSAGVQYAEKSRFHESFKLMARDGGYWYYILPRLHQNK